MSEIFFCMLAMLQSSPLRKRLEQGSYMQDNTMRAWDMRPYAPQNRCMKVFTGHQHSFERNSLRCDWSPDGSKVRPLPALVPASYHPESRCLQQPHAHSHGTKSQSEMPITGH